MKLLLYISILLIFSSVVTSLTSEDDCTLISKWLNDNEYDTGCIWGCTTNSNGVLTSLELNNYNISDDVIKTILKQYTEIESLEIFDDNDDEDYDRFPSEIGELKKLKELYIYSNTGIIDKKTFQLPKSITTLTFQDIMITQTIVDEIVTLEKLEFLSFDNCNYEKKLNLKSIKNLPLLSTLKLNDDSINENIIDSFKNVKDLTLGGNDFHLLQSHIEKIKTLTNLDKLLIIQNEYDEKLNFDSLNGLANLTSMRLIKRNCYEAKFEWSDSKYISLSYNIDSNNEYECGIDNTVLNAFSVLNNLTITSLEISQDNINGISLLNNLKELHIIQCRFNDVNIDFDSLKNFNITTLDMQGSKEYIYSQDRHYKLREVPNFVYSLYNLKKLIIKNHEIEKLVDQFTDLVKLEYIDFSDNIIESEIPESFNNLKNLKYVNFSNNKNLNGKALSNDSIEECYYNDDYTLCKEKNMECLKPYSFNYCSATESSVEQVNAPNNNNNNIQTEIKTSKSISTSTSLSDIVSLSTSLRKIKTTSTTVLKVKATSTTVPKVKATSTSLPKKSTSLSKGNVSKTTTTKTNRKVAAASVRKITIVSTTIKKVTIISTTIQKATVLPKTTQKVIIIPTTVPKDNNSFSVSKNGRCGSDQGHCPSDECCSKYGWCGTSEEHCNISEGCQSEFGVCNQYVVYQVSTNESCDEKDGGCNQDVEDQLSFNEKCNEKDGNCNQDVKYQMSVNGRCGEKDGICPSGECCSKYGWCGSSEEHCNINEGCQSEFGACNQDVEYQVSTNESCDEKDGGCNQDVEDQVSSNEKCDDKDGSCNQDVKYQMSVNGRCGEKDGICPSGECCSKYGWCGSSEEHCNINEGCQSEFGVCNGIASTNTSTNNKVSSTSSTEAKSTFKSESSNHGKCGEGFGKCSDGQCCSQYGWCGKSDEYCSLDQGCQSQFGECH